jgi:hypothetical protein
MIYGKHNKYYFAKNPLNNCNNVYITATIKLCRLNALKTKTEFREILIATNGVYCVKKVVIRYAYSFFSEWDLWIRSQSVQIPIHISNVSQ